MAFFLAQLSHELNRQIGLLINRKGGIETVIVGDNQSIVIPPLPQSRVGAGRLKGLRLLHTHLKGEPISEEDRMDLALLRLDLVSAIGVNQTGQAQRLYTAYLQPDNPEGKQWTIMDPEQIGQSAVEVSGLIRSLEEEWSRKIASRKIPTQGEKAILVSVTTQSRAAVQESMQELGELARSAGLWVLETVIQTRKKVSPNILTLTCRISSRSRLRKSGTDENIHAKRNI